MTPDSTDIWSSSVVIWLSERLGGEWAWLAQASAWAALAVAFIVVYVNLQLGQQDGEADQQEQAAYDDGNDRAGA